MVWFSVSHLKIMTARHVLREAGIESFVLDKMDSAHANMFGEIQIIVNKEDEARTREILIKAEII